jgi:hypothetical protein
MGASDPRADPLEALREQLERTQAAARRLARDAAAAGRRPPAAGWQAPGAARTAPAGVLALGEALRDVLPAELHERLLAVLRELLLLLRALIDYALERLEARRAPAPEVQDIPIA